MADRQMVKQTDRQTDERFTDKSSDQEVDNLRPQVLDLQFLASAVAP